MWLGAMWWDVWGGHHLLKGVGWLAAVLGGTPLHVGMPLAVSMHGLCFDRPCQPGGGAERSPCMKECNAWVLGWYVMWWEAAAHSRKRVTRWLVLWRRNTVAVSITLPVCLRRAFPFCIHCALSLPIPSHLHQALDIALHIPVTRAMGFDC